MGGEGFLMNNHRPFEQLLLRFFSPVSSSDKMIKPIKGGIIEFPRLSRCLGSTFSNVECGSGRSCDKTFGSKDSKPNLNFWT